MEWNGIGFFVKELKSEWNLINLKTQRIKHLLERES